MRVVSPGMLEMLGLLSSRDDGSPRTTMRWRIRVDRRRDAAARAWPGQPAVGQRLRLPLEIDRRVCACWTTVVGVVRHVRFRSLDEEGPVQAYVPSRQTLRADATSYVVRTAIEPSRLIAPVTRAVTNLDPLLPPYDVRPLQAYVTRGSSARRFTVVLASSFAFLASLLAAVGLAGLVSYSVTSRVREFGCAWHSAPRRAACSGSC